MIVLGGPELLPREDFLSASCFSLRSVVVLVAAHLGACPHPVENTFSTIGTGLVGNINVDPWFSVPVSSDLPNHLRV